MEKILTEACIFDLDGVLVDTARYHFLAWRRLANALAIDFDEEMNEQLKGVSRVESLEQILRWGGIEKSNEEKIELCRIKNEWYLKHLQTLDESEILPYALEFLHHLKDNNIKIALGSASKNAAMVLEKTGLTPFFQAIIDGTNTINSKPHPEVFLNGAKALSVNPANTIVFEDSEKGIEAANSGNFKSVGIGEEEVLTEAMMVIPNFKDIRITHFNRLYEST